MPDIETFSYPLGQIVKGTVVRQSASLHEESAIQKDAEEENVKNLFFK